MAHRGFIPYGKLADGKHGFLLENGTSVPLAAVLEVEDTLPPAGDSANFPGRLIFSKDVSGVYVFIDDPSPAWVSLDGIPADVGAVSGSPPTSPSPETGKLFFDTDTEVMFVWDGAMWQPMGGRYAAQILTQQYIGDGFDTSFPTGATSLIAPDCVEVFLDGVRQYPNPGGDYTIVGTNVVFNTAPPQNIKILITTLESNVLSQNAQMSHASYTASASQTDFSTGVSLLDPAGIFVFVNGVLKSKDIDYVIDQQDTTINTIIKTSPTIARVETNSDHHLASGYPIEIGGASETAYNKSFTVGAILSSTRFEISVNSGDPSSATPNPVLYFTPSYRNDTIQFMTPMIGGEVIDIRSLKNAVVAPSAGEANTLASLGSGVPIHSSKVGTVLQLKSLVSGANIGMVDSGTEITISATNAASFEDRVGINTSTYPVSGNESYIGVRNTTNPVQIDLSPITASPSNSGRKITICDESGNAGMNNIIITPGSGRTIDGGASYIINTNYGALTIVCDGTHWFIINEKI